MGRANRGRHELFAQELAKGTPKHEAWLKAGFTSGRAQATRASQLPEVAARVAELQKAGAEMAVKTVADIIRQLDEDRKFARDEKAPAAAISATMGQAKVSGLLVDRQEVTGKDGGPVQVSDAELADLLLHQLIRGGLAATAPGGPDRASPQATKH